MSELDQVQSKKLRIAIAALCLESPVDWQTPPLERIAQDAGVTYEEFIKETPTTCDLIPFIIELIDTGMFLETNDTNSNKEEKLFDAFMERFEAMQPLRTNILSLAEYARHNPACALAFYKAHKVMISKIWDHINEKTQTPCSIIQEHGLLLIYHYSFIAWEKDQSPDLSNTMATLDKAIKKAKYFNLFAT